MTEIGYDRRLATAYAARWALSRNPAYYNFDKLGGDCTNFLSQCLFSGGGVMNPKINTGWYYYSLSSRAPAWTGVDAFYNFLVNNNGVGPYAVQSDAENVTVGDFVQLATIHPYFHHGGIIVEKASSDLKDIYIACHTDDYAHRALSTYPIQKIRFLKIMGVRNY